METAKPNFKELKKQMDAARILNDGARRLLADGQRQEQEVREACARVRRRRALDSLKNIDLEELKKSRTGIRTAALKEAGYSNLWELARLKDWELCAIDGIGEKQAEAIRSVTAEFVNHMAQHAAIRLSVEKSGDDQPENVDLLIALARFRKGQTLREEMEKIDKELEDFVTDVFDRIEIRSGMHWIFSGRGARERTVRAAEDLHGFQFSPVREKVCHYLEEYRRIPELGAEEAKEDFRRNGADYYAILEEYGGSVLEKPLIYSSIPAQLASAVDETEIDLSCFKGHLRSYQLFGAKYILFERRVLLGDEMGLGKTVQAVAAMCDVYAGDPKSRFLVVCPASVLVNWCREIKKFSAIETYLLHGSFLEEEFDRWKEHGGAAVTNFETMGKIVDDIDKRLKIAMLVVDEAHYIKNPDAKRTKYVRALDEESDRILMMTGTPLENRVEEMCSLIDFVRPDMTEEIRRSAYMSHVPEFREMLAPVYLRRQRDQVLEELPPIEEKQEWCALTESDRTAYEASVREKNFMAMRRISFLQEDLENSSKAVRLLELCRDAEEDGRKIVIYSFFRETVEKVRGLLGGKCVGVITGSTEISERQGMIDQLKDAKDGSVLICQIQAGGTGLNIQAASVAIFCEPQIKPSLTNQAIARVYRMGQVRNVLVYHLLCENTVDEAVVQILERKQQEFDIFADESSIGEAMDNLVDKEWIRELIERENEKADKGDATPAEDGS